MGHPNRKMMLQKIECNPDDPILITNDDNFLREDVYDKMLTGMTKAGRNVLLRYVDQLL